MVSHMMPTCAFVFVIGARDPGEGPALFTIRHVYIMIGWNVMEGRRTIG
jgi:hypothetical protein